MVGAEGGGQEEGHHHLTQPLMRIFEPVCKDVKAELLSGEWTCSILHWGWGFRRGNWQTRARNSPQLPVSWGPRGSRRRKVCSGGAAEGRGGEGHL